MVNVDRRDFHSKPAIEESRGASIMATDYCRSKEKSGWEITHIIQALMSSKRFQENIMAAMQRSKILDVTSRYVVLPIRPA